MGDTNYLFLVKSFSLYHFMPLSSINHYNIACVLPYLIPTGVIMVHHGTFLNIRTAVRPSDDVCKSDGEVRMRSMLKNFLQRDNTIKMLERSCCSLMKRQD